MAKQKDLSVPKVGMNRSTSPHLLQEGEYGFQLNGNSYDEGGEKFNLTDEHSNILATKFKDGFKFIGGKNHVVRNKTYIFLTNPETGVSEIGCIRNTTDFIFEADVEAQAECTDCPEYINIEATPLEEQEQVPHQVYETLLEDSCNLCLGFDIEHPIIDIIIKEQNIGTKMFWTATPGNKEFRYVELDELNQYKLTGDDNCGAIPTETCLDCDKLKVFRLYTELKTKSYERTLGGNLKKGSYEVLGAYSDILGNEFTSYVSLSPIIPIFDEANIIHEQEDNNAETNFSIKVELDNVDIRFDYYKIAVRYFTSKGVFTSFVEGIHNTSDKSVIISDNNGQSISNNKLTLVKPFVETVDGATASNNILLLNGVREREPINLQPVMNLAGLGVKWMSFRAKEDLYANADSYKYLGYNRDENVALAIDFGMKDGYRTNPYVFVPRPATTDELSDFTTGDDYESVTSAAEDCDGNLRDAKWQFYNTAYKLPGLPNNCDVQGVQTNTVTETTTTFVTYDTEYPIPGGNITLTDTEGFVDLKFYLEDNINNCSNINIPNICDHIDVSNTNTTVGQLEYDTSNFPQECNNFTNLNEASINILSVENEVVNSNEKPLIDYGQITQPNQCNIIQQSDLGGDLLDEEFYYRYGLTSTTVPPPTPNIFKRYNVSNFSALNSQDLVVVNNSNSNSSSGVFHNNLGADNLSDLLSTKVSLVTNSNFNTNLHEGALWFKTDINNRDKFYIELSKKAPTEDSSSSPTGFTSNVRVNIYDSIGSTSPLYSQIVDLSQHNFIGVDILNNEIGGQSVSLSSLANQSLYIAIDLPIVQTFGYGDNWQTEQNNGFPNLPTQKYRLQQLDSCFFIVDRNVEYESITITFDQVNLQKQEKWEITCEYDIPVLKDCEPVPFEYGELGYYESTDTYPDNEELYNSSTLKVSLSRITNADLQDKLTNFYTNGVDAQGDYIWSETGGKSLTDFRCREIRHYKLPDNKVSPFIGTSNVASNSDSIISPLGFTIDGEVITNMLNVALDNGLITQEQRNNITDYKIYRSDSTLDRSVVASGIVFNTKKYTVEGENIHYFNYPFNSLGKDKYYPNNTDDPFDKIQAISPEFDYYRPSLPTEMSLQGFMFGKSNSRVLPVEDHAKMVILGRKARSLANTLAILEVVAEAVITTSTVAAQASNSYRWISSAGPLGFYLSINPIGSGIATGAIIATALLETLSAVVYKVGKYRLEWLNSFENLGAPYNFGYYMAAGSNYNYLKTLQTDGDRLRGLSVRKYLKSGMLNVSDTVSGNVVKINNIDREEAPFFSLGNYPIDLSDDMLYSEYTTYDNSNITPNFSSQILSSEIGCHQGKSPEQLRNIASPYVAFKNYIPNQYGTIGSIKWIDTTYCIPITEEGSCNGILGGDTFISRHSKKRKARLFETDLLGSADLTPFPYRFNANYGDPRFYIDYKVNSEFEAEGEAFPDIFYDVKFDCNTSSNNFYVEPPGKFYLYNIAFTNFLCETRVNTNFRNARKEPWNQFYPQNTDYEAITQPTTVSLTRPENYFYNKAYLQSNVLNTVFPLPEYYSKENEAKKAYNRNSVIYSLPDVNENSITEPWLLYRPNDKATLESTYGHLINMKGIESDQILLYFEDALQLQNSVNQFTDGSTQYNSELGNGGIFAKRAITLRTTDIGYGGTQSKHTLSCEFGHFHADLKRGQVFNYIGGTDMKEISRYSNGKPNGMDVWFKEHLPLKILKQFPDYTAPDNPHNGVGIHWGYDSKYRRVLLTKKDYKPKGAVVNCDSQFYNANIADYQDVITTYTDQGYTFEGVEDCQLKFSQEGINSNTDIYAIFDTTSMQVTDGQAASTALNQWFVDFQASNPLFTGNLYIIPFSNEAYVSFPTLIQSGAINPTTFGGWASIAVLPPDLNTVSWVPPTDLLLLAFVDETNSQYHGNTITGGFSSSGIVQPTTTYFNNYQSMITSVNSYNSFRGVVYPIVQSLTGTGGALVLQTLAAMKGIVLNATDIANTGTAVDVSILLTENPYENAPIPGTSPQQLLEPLETYNWVAQYDKTSPASAVFTSQQFQDDLNTLINTNQNDEIVFEPLDEIDLADPNYFDDISWTVTYKPETGSWESYMSYTPNYYINHTDYFQSGINSDDDRHGLWSHLLTNKSYRVFYGQKFPYIIEYPIKNEYFSKRLESFNWNAQLRRYHNEYDYAPIEANPFTAVTIYNNYENSGRLIPIKNSGALSQLSKYPITKSNNTQEVLISYDNYRYNLDYFYNRVSSNRNNQPIWLWDENQINKTINNKAVSFYGKKTLERLKGNFFMVRLERDGNTNYDLDFRWSEQLINPA